MLEPLAMHVNVTNALTSESGGCIECVIQDAKYPVHIEWLHEGASALLTLNDARNRAVDVPPGAYEIVARDAMGRECAAIANVRMEEVPTVLRYDIVHASSDTARDGSIVAHTEHMQATQYLWTSGVITNTPQLFDVRPGMYTVTPLRKDGLAYTFYHASSPAVVHPSKHSIEV